MRRLAAGTAPIAVVVALASCSGGSHGFPARANELEANVRYLASVALEGRLPGTAGYDSAAAYAGRALARAGVRPVWRDATGRPAYFQRLAMVRNQVGPGTALELRSGGTTTRLPHGQRSFLLLAAGRDGGHAEARSPVFVGNGLHVPEYGVDDFAGLPLAGHPVLLTAYPPPKAELARLPEPVRGTYSDPRAAQLRRLRDIGDARASAILLLPDRWLVAEWDELSAEQRRLDYEPTEDGTTLDSLPAIPAAMLHADLVDRLFVGRGYHPISHAGRYHTFELADLSLRLIVDVRRHPFATANVIGLVPGRDRALRHEYLVVGAGLDGQGREGKQVLRGTHDAAACAAVLEAAAFAAAHPPRRSVLFVLYTAEQGGRWGSRHFLAHLPLPREDLVAAIDVGHVGRSARARGIEAFAAPPLVAIARSVAAEAGHDLLDVHDAAGHPGAFRGTAAGVFDAGGVPSLLLLSGGSQGWPMSADEPGQVDMGRLQDATRLLEMLVARVGDARGFGPTRRPGARTGSSEDSPGQSSMR